MTTEAEIMAARYGLPVVIALVAVVVRLVMTSQRPSLWGVIRGVFVGVFVGVLVHAVLLDMGYSQAMTGAGVGVSAILAEDLISAVLKIGGEIRRRPQSLFAILTRGRNNDR